MQHLYNIYVFSMFYLYSHYTYCSAESTYFMDTERPKITYINKLYITNFTITARRNNRKDPRHFVDIYVETTVPADNDIKMDFYFYQFLTNRYRPSFVELHFGLCDFVDMDPIMGAQIKRHAKLLNISCPYPPGPYHLKDMVISYIPKNFPFQKGRIYYNMTLHKNNKPITLVCAHIDMEIKQWIVRKSKQQ